MKQRTKGRSIQAHRKARPKLTPAVVCKECGNLHIVRGDPTRPSCIHHTTRDDGTLMPCGNPPLKNRNVCFFHGGRTPTGPASRFWKHGAYSQHLPTRYLHAFELSLRDPELTSMKYQLALLDARETELIKRLDTSESGAAWVMVKELAVELKNALDGGHKNLLASTTVALLNAMDVGISDNAQWAELYAIMELRRKISETERKREEGLKAHMTLDEMTKVASFIAGLMRRYVPDQKALRHASLELSEFFNVFQDQPIIEGEVIEIPAEMAKAEKMVAKAVPLAELPAKPGPYDGAVMALDDSLEEQTVGVPKGRRK